MTEIHRICAVLGELAFQDICRKLGGDEIYIPKQVTKDHAICKAVGIVAAAKLVRAFGGAKLYIPIPKAAEMIAPRLQALLNQGLSTVEMARRFGVTPRHFRRLVNQCGLTNPDAGQRYARIAIAAQCSGASPAGQPTTVSTSNQPDAPRCCGLSS